MIVSSLVCGFRWPMALPLSELLQNGNLEDQINTVHTIRGECDQKQPD